MSVQSAIAFINKVNEDTALQNRIKTLKGGDLNALLNVATESGFKFTADDWSTAIVAGSSAELSEDDLNNVAGGIVVINSQPSLTINPILQSFGGTQGNISIAGHEISHG